MSRRSEEEIKERLNVFEAAITKTKKSIVLSKQEKTKIKLIGLLIEELEWVLSKD